MSSGAVFHNIFCRLGIAVAVLAPAVSTAQSSQNLKTTSISTSEESLKTASKTKVPVLKLSIEEAVIQSLQNNEGFLLQKHMPVITGAFEQIERGEYDPTVFVELSHSKQNTTEISRSTGEQFDVTVNETEGVAGVTQRTPLGTSVEAAVSSARNDSSRTPVQYSSRLGIGITQQLLQGGGPTVNLASLHQAKLETRISKNELAGYAQLVVAEVEVAYWEYVRAVESIEVVKKSLEVAEAKFRDIKEKIAVGAAPENDEAAAAAEVGLRRQRLIDAQSDRERLKLILLQQVVPGQKSPYDTQVVADSAFVTDDIEPGSVGQRVSVALKSRAEIAEAVLLHSKGKLEVQVTRNGVLPKLELFIDLGKTGYADSFSRSFSELSGPTYDVAAGIRFSHALGNRIAKAKKKAAVATVQMQKQAIENLQSVVTYEVYEAWNELSRAKQQVDVTAETRGYSEKALESVEAGFEVGSATLLAVVQAERDFLESEIAAVTAKVDYQIARIRLYQAEGSLLQRRGISIEE